MPTESLNPGGGSIFLPGYGLPPDNRTQDSFPVLISDEGCDWTAATLLLCERCMLKFIEDITNKPDWWVKANDQEIIARWKDEAITMPWTEYLKNADFTEKMADAKKAKIYEKTGLISDDLREALKSAAAPLENVPADRKDWHPGSDGRVLDLVHPSPWSLLYWRSRILPDKRINLQDCLDHCGMGVIIPEPPITKLDEDWHGPFIQALCVTSCQTLQITTEKGLILEDGT